MSSLKYILLLGAALMAAPVMAQEAPVTASAQKLEAPKSGTLKFNLRRLGLEMSSTDVSHAREYKDSPVSQFNADSQTVIKGVFDGALEYDRSNLQWTNTLFMEYGKTKLKPVDEPADTNETADQILLTSEYTHKLWHVRDLDIGPMANIGYQTEFTENQDAPRTKIARAKAGIRVFSGKIIKDLYLAGIYEYDMTYPEHVSKSAAEIGWRLEHDIKDGVRFSTDGYYRDYLSFSQYVGEDLEYDLKATARMDVNLTKTLTFGPYVSYRLGKARQASVTGSNFMIGLSLGYRDLFNIF